MRKRCTRCGVIKPVSEFSVSRQGIRGPIYNSRCKPCQSALALEWFKNNKERAKNNKHAWQLRIYGITPERYLELLAEQGGVCAICGKDEPNEHGRTGTKFRLSVDHCHATNRVRGLLCQRCNRAVGLLGDDISLLRKAIDYLERE